MVVPRSQSISVVHLVWLPFGLDLFKGFVESYQRYGSGTEHELVFLFNGVDNEDQLASYHELAAFYRLTYKSFNLQKGWDLEAYRWVASKVETDYILFLNSYCRFTSENWLLYFIRAASLPGVGIVGATGSYQSIFTMIQYELKGKGKRGKTFKENFRKLKLFLKNSFLYRLWFAPFPNPHIRTGEFFINRRLFLELSFIPIKKKYDAYRLESGRIGFTQQILKKGLKPVIVDRNGSIYEVGQWKESNTFWISDQANLLISDNQTRKYMVADSHQKNFYTFMAWGC